MYEFTYYGKLYSSEFIGPDLFIYDEKGSQTFDVADYQGDIYEETKDYEETRYEENY